MPVYEYECEPCRIIYEVRQGMQDPPLETCPECQGSVARIMSAPNVNRYNFSSPTEAKYAKLSLSDEVKKERELQKEYRKIWLPPPVVHSPWDDD
jgi:putative FmdB family regulatory protein